MRAGVCLTLSLWVLVTGCSGPSADLPGMSRGEVTEERRRQATFYLQNYLSQSSRLNSVAHRLMIANRADCKRNLAPRIGFAATTIEDFPVTYREFAAEALGFNKEKPNVYWVAENGAAGRAGMKAGDAVLAVDGVDVPLLITTRDIGMDTAQWMAERLKNSGGRAVQIDVLRAGKTHNLRIQPEVGCGFPVILRTDAAVNAYTDGEIIVVYSSMLRVAQTDPQLALLVGHELAHATLKHLDKDRQNEFVGTLGGAALDVALALGGINTGGAIAHDAGKAAVLAYSQAFEKEADYVGSYYAARAGYDVSGVEYFWRAAAMENPKGIMGARGRTHPTSPERFVLLQKTAAEIAEKKKRGAPLNPEFRQVAAASADEAAKVEH